MHQRFGLLSISLLIFSAVVVSAMALDPKAFALRDWQPLLASLLTLGGAGIVYRGATLAYRAAMAKVDLDRELDTKKLQRQDRAILHRLRLTAHLTRHEADKRLLWLKDVTHLSDISIEDYRAWHAGQGVEDAWNNLEALPEKVARDLANLRIRLLNYELAIKSIEESGDEKLNLTNMRRALKETSEFSIAISEGIKASRA